MDLAPLFEKIGVSSQESRIFSEVGRFPEGVSVGHLAKVLHAPRPTLYGLLHALESKGLIKRGVGDRGSLFFGATRDEVSALFTEKADELEIARIQIEHNMTHSPRAYPINPKLFIFNERNATELTLRDILRSGEKKISWIIPIRQILTRIPKETLENFHRQRIAHNIHLRVLWTPNHGVGMKNHPELLPNVSASLRQIRTLPKELSLEVGYGIYGNKVAFTTTRKESLGFTVESEDLSAAMQKQFDYLWSVSKPFHQ